MTEQVMLFDLMEQANQSTRATIEIMDTALTHTISFLGVAMIVAIIAQRLNLPYTVGLVLAGQGLAVAGLAVAGRETGVMLTHDFIFEVILPPLLFEAALSIRWRELVWTFYRLPYSQRSAWSSQPLLSRQAWSIFWLGPRHLLLSLGY